MNSNKTQKIVKDDLCLQEKGFHKKFREIERVFLIFTSNFKKKLWIDNFGAMYLGEAAWTVKL